MQLVEEIEEQDQLTATRAPDLGFGALASSRASQHARERKQAGVEDRANLMRTNV